MLYGVMKKLSTARDIYNRRGMMAVFQSGYKRYIRPKLSKNRHGVLNGITVGCETVPLLDKLIGVGYDKNYESNYISQIRKFVTQGSDIGIVGGGWGVSTVVAANQTGSHGSIDVFEASLSETKKVKRTCEINGLQNQVTVHHAVVGDVYSLRGTENKGGASTISLPQLQKYDILMLDCDGCEMDLLSNICELDESKPNKLIIEHHGVADCVSYDPDKVKNYLYDGGYTIIETSTELFRNANRNRPEETIFVAKLKD